MLAKEREQIKARHLRHKGLSVNKISSILRVSKSSVSTWVRDVRLTKPQKKFLSHNKHTREVVERRVATRLKNENARRREIMEGHKKLISDRAMTLDNLLILGTTLYWAEGGKSQKNRSFNFTNSDPAMIRIMMVFLKEICRIPDTRFRAHIHLHSHLNKNKAQKYWSAISRIPKAQFYKITQVINKSSKNTRDTLPYGTFSIQIGSTDLFLKMLAWIEVINERVATAFPK